MISRLFYAHQAQQDHRNVSGNLIELWRKNDFGFINLESIDVCILYDHDEYVDYRIYDENNVIFTFISIYWADGITFILDSVYNGVTRIITEKPYSPTFLLSLIEKYQINYLSVPPIQMIGCVKSDVIHDVDLSCVRSIEFLGCRAPHSLVVEINRFFPNAEMVSWYGLTEIGDISKCVYDPHENGCGGELLNGSVVKIVDDQMNRCGPNVNGEICAKTDCKFLGYLDDPKATSNSVDSEGFFKTGDVGHVDENGHLFIEERKKSIIHLYYYGESVLPSEIEEFLITLPDVEEVCVVGILIVSDLSLLAAVVVRKPKSNLSQKDVFAAVAGAKLFLNYFLISLLKLFCVLQKNFQTTQNFVPVFILLIRYQKHRLESLYAEK